MVAINVRAAFVGIQGGCPTNERRRPIVLIGSNTLFALPSLRKCLTA